MMASGSGVTARLLRRLAAGCVMVLGVGFAGRAHADPTSSPGALVAGAFGEGVSTSAAPDPATGAMRHTYGFSLAPSRGRVQPSLSVSYSSSSVDREAGYG